MTPYIEIDGAVFEVVDWSPDEPMREKYELRKFDDNGTRRCRRLKNESDIELWVNMKSVEPGQ